LAQGGDNPQDCQSGRRSGIEQARKALAKK
jgi:hypothetical protein